MPDILSGEFMPYGTPDPVPFDKPWPTSRALVTSFIKMEVKPYGSNKQDTTPIGYVQGVTISYPRPVQGIWELGNFLPIEIVPSGGGQLPSVSINTIVLRPGAPWSRLPGAEGSDEPVVTGTLLERVNGYPQAIKRLVASRYADDPMFDVYSLVVNLITAVIPIDIYLKVYGQKNGQPFVVTYRLVEVWPTQRRVDYRADRNRIVIEQWQGSFRYIVVDTGNMNLESPVA